MATYATRSQDARLLETPGVTIQAHRQCMFLPVCVGHVFFVSYELYREHQWERNLTKHHRNTIAPSSCYTPFNKIIATVTKQLASQIIEPIFLIYVDLRWLRDLHFRYRGLLLVSLGALGLTFGTTQGHQKDHLGPPWRTSETRHRKNTKKSLVWDLFCPPKLNEISSFCFTLVFTRVPSDENEFQMSQNVRKRMPKLHLFSSNSQIEKLRFDCAGASGSRVKAPRNR